MHTSALIEQLLQRGSVRAFASEPVEDALIQRLLQAATRTSSKSDLQQFSIIRVTAPALRRTLGTVAPSMPWIVDAPEFLVFCGDAHRFSRIAALHGASHPGLTLENFFNASADAAFALQTFVLAAESVGLGTCPISAVRHHAADVAQWLGLPPGVFPVAGLCVGYPRNPVRATPRFPAQVTVHADRYDDGDLAGQVQAYDAVRARLLARQDGPADALAWSRYKAQELPKAQDTQFNAWLAQAGLSVI